MAALSASGLEVAEANQRLKNIAQIDIDNAKTVLAT